MQFRVLFIVLNLCFCVDLYALVPVQQISTVPDSNYVKQLLDESINDLDHGNFSSARAKIKRAEFLSDSLNFKEGKVLSLARFAEVFLYQQKNDSALAVLNEALTLYPKSNNLHEVYNLTAVSYAYKNKFDLALENYEKAIEYASNLPKEKKPKFIASVRMNMAGVYIEQGNQQEAFENYLTSVRFSEASGDTVFG